MMPLSSPVDFLALIERLDTGPLTKRLAEHVATGKVSGYRNLIAAYDDHMDRLAGFAIRLDSGQDTYQVQKPAGYFKDLRARVLASDIPATKSIHEFLAHAVPYFMANVPLVPEDRIITTNALFNMFALSRMYEFTDAFGRDDKKTATHEQAFNDLYFRFVGWAVDGDTALNTNRAATRTDYLHQRLTRFRDDVANSRFIHYAPDDLETPSPYNIPAMLQNLRFALRDLGRKEGIVPRTPEDSVRVAPLDMVRDLFSYLTFHGDKLPPAQAGILRVGTGMLLDQLMMLHLHDAASLYDTVKPHFMCLAPFTPYLLDRYMNMQPQETPQDVMDAFRQRLADERSGLSGKARDVKSAKLGVRLEIFETLCREVPAGMELVSFYFTRRPAVEKTALRKDIDAKKAFLKATARRHWFSLLRMKVRPKDIFHLATIGSVPSDAKGALYDMSIEHVYDLSGGGFNEHLCLMTLADNHKNGRLIELQTFDLPVGETRCVVAYGPTRRNRTLIRQGRFTRRAVVP